MKRTKQGYMLDGVDVLDFTKERKKDGRHNSYYMLGQSAMQTRVSMIKGAVQYEPRLFLYANKANRLIDVQRILIRQGLGIQAGDIGEIYLGLIAGCPPEKMRTTKGAQDIEYLRYAHDNGVKVYLDSHDDFERWEFLINKGLINPDFPVGARVNPGEGDGEDTHRTVTSGTDSEKGIWYTQMEQIKKRVRDNRINMDALEMHIGSNFPYANIYFSCLDKVLELALDFENSGIPIREISGGGGKGRAYPTRRNLDIGEFGKTISEKMEEHASKAGRRPLLVFEDGRWYVVDGILVGEIGSIKKTRRDSRKMVVLKGIGIPNVLRIAMYGSRHSVYNLSKPFGANELVDLRSDDCERVELGEHAIGKPQVGDFIAIGQAGAYCVASMENPYGGKTECDVYLAYRGNVDLIRPQPPLEDLIRNEVFLERLGGRPLDLTKYT